MAYFNKVLVQTGNLIDMKDQIRLVSQSTSDELKGCIKSALNEWSADTHPLPNEDGALLVQGGRAPLLYSSRGISTTVKLFLSGYEAHHVTDAIKTVMRNTGRERVESVIISPPDVSDDAPLRDLIVTWTALEAAVDEGLVKHVGIADVSWSLFKQLYDWARVKPSTIQVNLDECCSVNEDLREFARANDVQMMTHCDDAEMMDEEMVAGVLARVGATDVECAVPWLARHRTIHVCFGVILDKGYTLALDLRENIAC